MSLAKLINQPVSIIKNGAATDRYGNTIPSDVATVLTVGYLEQEASVETLDDRDVSVSSFVAYFPAGTDVNALDRVVFGTQTFQIDGEPWIVYNPRIQQTSHVRAKLKVVS